jgi:hypothetical protein
LINPIFRTKSIAVKSQQENRFSVEVLEKWEFRRAVSVQITQYIIRIKCMGENWGNTCFAKNGVRWFWYVWRRLVEALIRKTGENYGLKHEEGYGL